MAGRKTVEFGYWSLKHDERSTRKVDPYTRYGSTTGPFMLSATATCAAKSGPLFWIGSTCFKSQIIVSKLPDDFSFEDYVGHSFKVMQDELYGVTIRISPAWARYVGEKIWHESQQIQKLIDGGIEISFKVAGLDEIRQWVMSLGPEAVVVAPDELRLSVEDSLRATLSQYTGIEDDIRNEVVAKQIGVICDSGYNPNMYVKCKQCNTAYNLDAGFIKNSGTKVRCSACKHIFVVYPEAAAMQPVYNEPVSVNRTEITGNQSPHKEVVDEDLGYLQEKESQIKRNRVNFNTIFENGGHLQQSSIGFTQNDTGELCNTSEDELNDKQESTDPQKLKDYEKCFKSTNERNKNFTDKDQNLTSSIEKVEIGSALTDDEAVITDPPYNSDDVDIDEYLENCLVNSAIHDSDVDLPVECSETPCVPTLDDDLDFSLFDQGQDGPGEHEQHGWDNFDYEPEEFNEETLPQGLIGIDDEKGVSGEDRALQMAMKIGNQYDWDFDEVKLLANVFTAHGWSFTRSSIINELELGMTFTEFEYAVKIRRIWHSHAEFSTGYSVMGSFGDNSLKYQSVYKYPDWSLCLKIVRGFDSLPDSEEMERHFVSLHTNWKYSPALQNQHITYYGFIRDIVDDGDASLDMLDWKYFHYGEIGEDYFNSW